MFKKSFKYNCVFVVGGVPGGFITGGDRVTFQLIRNMINNNLKLALVVLDHKEAKELHLNNKRNKHIILKIFKRLPVKIQFIMPRVIFWLRNESESFKFLSKIDVYSSSFFKKSNLTGENVVATWWGTAFYVDLIRHKADKVYYLIQNHEDNISFSGIFHNYASKSYNLNLNKIVINTSLYNRFIADNPKMMRIGIDYHKWYYNGQKEDQLLIPLRTGEYKGFEYGIRALKKIHFSIPSLKIVGFGNIKPVDVPDFVNYYYMPTDAALANLYRKSKYFILPSIVEGFPLVSLEAMASKCAVISTKFEGSDDYLKDGYNSVLVPIRDSDAIADAMIRLYASPDITEKIAQNGQILAAEYSLEAMYNDFRNILWGT